MAKKERQMIDKILLDYSKKGWRLFRVNAGLSFRGKYVVKGLPAGVSDLIGFTDKGRFVAIEVKSGRTKLTQAQKDFLKIVNDAGGIGLVHRE